MTGPPAEFCPAFSPPESDVPSLAPVSGDVCNCQPGTLTLTIDYDMTCENSTIVTGDPGIKEARCLIFSQSDLMVTDPVPVSVDSVVIFELDANLDIVNTTTFNSSFASGDTVVYESFAVTNTDEVAAGRVPRALQVNVNGFNAAGDDLTNSYVILYTNECDIYPVLNAGSTIGWTSLVSCFAQYFRFEHLTWHMADAASLMKILRSF